MTQITTVPDLADPFVPEESDESLVPDVRDPPPKGPTG